MHFDPVLLARLQFAFTVIFHIIFPTFTIGLSAYIATLGVMWVRSGEDRYHLLMRFWTRIFAVSFAMGVVSGIVMSYEFGLNWSRFSAAVGNVIGPLIGYEVLMAFFLEATFIGLFFFGWDRLSKVGHLTVTWLVAIGSSPTCPAATSSGYCWHGSSPATPASWWPPPRRGASTWRPPTASAVSSWMPRRTGSGCC